MKQKMFWMASGLDVLHETAPKRELGYMLTQAKRSGVNVKAHP